AAIDGLGSVDELPGLLGRLQRQGMGGAFDSYVNSDDRQSDQNIVNVVQGGLGLPDEAYYREDDFAELREAYVAHVAAMFGLLGWSDDAAADGATRVMALET